MSEERLHRLEGAVKEIVETLDRLEKRVSSLEGVPLEAESPPAAAVPGEARPPSPRPSRRGPHAAVGVFSLTGRIFLVLGGAYLLRAITDAAVVPRLAGVALGLVYAFVWLPFADRAAARGRGLSALFHGFATVFIGYPFLVEVTTKFDILAPGSAAAILIVLTSAAFFVSYRRNLRPLAWAFTPAALATIFALLAGTERLELYSAVLLGLAGASVWLSYGRRWNGLQWIVALAVDLEILWITLIISTPGRVHDSYKGLTATEAQILAVGLMVVYLGSFAVYALARRRDVAAFEVLQSAAALLVGFGGAVRIAHGTGSENLPLGLAALAAGGLSYAVGFAFVRRLRGRGRNFIFYTSLAIALILVGSPVLAKGSALASIWSVLALATALLGGRFNRVTLRAHAAIYAFAAVFQAGILRAAAAGFASAPEEVFRLPGGSALFVLALTAATYVVLVWARKYRRVPQLSRIPRFAILLLAILGCSRLAVTALVLLFAGTAASPDTAAVAVARTAVLASSAIALAAARRGSDLAEMAWPVYPILAFGGGKILLEDLRSGEPAALFLSFGLYGIALIVAPRLLHGRGAGGDGSSPPDRRGEP